MNMDAYPIKCTQCSKSFLKKTKLTAHMRTVHSGIKYDCNFCEKQYGSKQGLTAHKKTIHKEELHKVDIPVSNNPHSSLSPNPDTATALLKAKVSSLNKDDQVNNANKSDVAKKVPGHMEDANPSDVTGESKLSNMRQSLEFTNQLPAFIETGENEPNENITNQLNEALENIILSKEKDSEIKEKQKSSSKVAKKDLKKATVSLVSKLEIDNEFYVNDKQDKMMEKEILNKVNPKKGQKLNPKIKFDFTPFESQNRKEIKAEGDVSKENNTPTSFASDCQINHEDCQDKDFDKSDETIQTEVEDDDKDSCLWAHCDNLFADEELEFTKVSAVNAQSHLDTQEIPLGNTILAYDHTEENVLELQSSKGNHLKNSEVGFNASSDKPRHSKEPQNVAQNSGISLDSLVVPKKDMKIDISQEITPEDANLVVEKFVCETIGCKKIFTAKGDLDEHMKTADGQNRKCPLCLKDFFNEECRKYHKDQNCGVDTESDEEVDEDDDEDFDLEAEEEEDWDEDEMEGLKSEHEKVKDMDREHNKLDDYENLKETDDDKHIVLKSVDQREADKLVQNEKETKVDFNEDKMDKERNDTLDKVEGNSKLLVNDVTQYPIKDGIQTQTNDVLYSTKNAIPTAIKDAQHSTIDGIQMPTKDVYRPTNAFIPSSPSYAQHPTKEGIQPLSNYAQFPSKNTIETQQNNVEYPTENATQTPTNDVQHHTINVNQNATQLPSNDVQNFTITANNVQYPARSVNQKSCNDIKYTTKNDKQQPVYDDKHPIENGNQVTVNDVKHPTENISEASSSYIGQEKTFSLKEKQILYRYEQQWKQLYLKAMPCSPEQLIQMSEANFDNISSYFNQSQLQFCKTIRDKFLKLQSKPAPSNILQEKLPIDNSMQNKTIPKQMLKRKGELVNNEPLSKKIHLESKAVKEEDEDPSFNKIRQSVLKGLDLGNNNENYEVIIEDGKVKLRIIGNNSNSSESLNEDNDEGSGDDISKWKNYSDCEDRSFSNGGPTIPEGWKIYFEEQTKEGRKVMEAKYMDPEGKFYNNNNFMTKMCH